MELGHLEDVYFPRLPSAVILSFISAISVNIKHIITTHGQDMLATYNHLAVFKHEISPLIEFSYLTFYLMASPDIVS